MLPWHDMILALAGFIGAELGHVVRNRLDQPHRWKCRWPSCQFAIRSNSKSTMQYAKNLHQKNHASDPSR